MTQTRVMHYLNQFFAGMGGEDKADVPLGSRDGALGPGTRLQQLLGNSAKIVVTAYCGDNFFSTHSEEVLSSIAQLVKNHDVNMVIAGPAFNAGRYGFACVEVCHALSASAGLYGVTGMYAENPGVTSYQQYKDARLFAAATADSVKGMEDALSKMAQLVSKLSAGSQLGAAADEGYMPRGIRVIENVNVKGAKRAVDMLMDKLAGRPFATEIPLELPEVYSIPHRIHDLATAQLALASTTGVHAAGNPHGFLATKDTKWAKYPIDKLQSMTDTKWDVVHGGYSTDAMLANPNYGVPLDVCRQMEREHVFAKLNPYLFATTGNGGAISAMQVIGKQMGAEMKAQGIDGVLLVSA